MDTLKTKFVEVGLKLENEEYDKNDFKCARDLLLKELSDEYESRDLFKVIFLNGMSEIDFDDKVLMVFGVDRYNVKKYEKKRSKMGLAPSNLNIDDFVNKIFSVVKDLVAKGLEYAKKIAMEKFDEFYAKAADALGKFIKEQGTKLIEKIIDRLRGGEKVEDINVKVQGVRMSLTEALDKDDIEKIEKLAEDVDEVYDDVYDKINENIKKVENGEEPEEFVIEEKKEEEVVEKKLKFCCF